MDTTEPLLAPLDGDTPCGPNLEYDPDFLTLEELVAPQKERAVGDAVKEAEEPDWREVARQAESLATRTRDLRVATHLATAWLKTGGLSAWADGLALVHELLERYWEEVHPRIDEDPVERINALSALGAPDGMLAYLRLAQVLHVERVGGFTLRDLKVLNGTLKTADDMPLSSSITMETIDAVMLQSDVEDRSRVHAAVTACAGHVEAIVRIFDERTPGMGPDLDALRRELRELQAFLHARIGEQEPGEPSHVGPAMEGTITGEGGQAPAARGAIRSTDDIRRMLDEICVWYERHEPSSPVPPLLRRARGLVGMGFGALLRALAPGGMAEFQQLTGETPEE